MIQMIGIDHTAAPVAVRSVYTFRKQEMIDTMQTIREETGARGIVILSTCNRMEIWLSTQGEACSILPALNAQKGLPEESNAAYFTSREGEEAAKHLFYLTSGLKSAILAEDQIVTQVGDALAFARAAYMTDSALEVLFRMAVTAAKKVKTEVVFSHADESAIAQAVSMLQGQGMSLVGKRCMVIGNGAYGKLAAQTLVAAGANVTVTVRQYHSGVVMIPEGCRRIHYGEKMELFPDCELVVSATTSPNYTLFYEHVSACRPDHHMILLDLAVPADIDPKIRTLPWATVYDIDDFRTEGPGQNAQAIDQAARILEEQLEEYHSWSASREVIPLIDHVKSAAGRDVVLRLHKRVHKLPLEEKAQEQLLAQMEDGCGKVVGRMLYTLRDALSEEQFRACVQALEETYVQQVGGGTE